MRREYLLLLGIIAALAAAPAHAQSVTAADLNAPPVNKTGAFFKNDIASTVFADVPEKEGQPVLEYFPRQGSDYVLPALEETLNVDPQKDPSEEDLSKLPAAERLARKYGDPAKDVPVLAKEDAPKPMQGLMAALQEGEDELAFQYAKQYVRYLRDIQSRTKRVVSMTGFAGQREGVIEKGNWSNAPQLLEDQILFERDIESAAKKSNAEGDEEGSEMNTQVRALVQRAQREQNSEKFSSGGKAQP